MPLVLATSVIDDLAMLIVKLVKPSIVSEPVRAIVKSLPAVASLTLISWPAVTPDKAGSVKVNALADVSQE